MRNVAFLNTVVKVQHDSVQSFLLSRRISECAGSIDATGVHLIHQTAHPRLLSLVRSIIVAFRSAKVAFFREAKGNDQTLIDRAILIYNVTQQSGSATPIKRRRFRAWHLPPAPLADRPGRDGYRTNRQYRTELQSDPLSSKWLC